MTGNQRTQRSEGGNGVADALLRLRVQCLPRGSFVAQDGGDYHHGIEVFNYSRNGMQTLVRDSPNFLELLHCVGDRQSLVNQRGSSG